MANVRERARIFAGLTKSNDRVLGEGLEASLLHGPKSDATNILGDCQGGLDCSQEQSSLPAVAPHSSTAFSSNNGESGRTIDAESVSGSSICLLDVMRKVPRRRAGIAPVDGGGVEAIPTVRGEDVAAVLRSEGFCSLLQLMPRSNCGAFAVASTDGSRSAATHSQLRALVKRERLSTFGIHRNDRCAVLLENGPELACAVMLCLARCTCVPINVQQTPNEIRAELQAMGCKALIVRKGYDAALINRDFEGPDMLVLQLVPDAHVAGLFSLEPHSTSKPMVPSGSTEDLGSEWEQDCGGLNRPSDTALMLHTSGTSGNKKIVPYSLETLCVGAACIMDSWALCADDVCLNMMPLFHVGGITRNVLAAILAGGGVVCAPGFDAALFVQVIESQTRPPITWYYAGPTMHTIILEHLRQRRRDGDAHGLRPRLRMVANASGALTASLAEQMRQEFGSVVLPSYGMTECMPISSPSCNYNLDHPNSSGQICGPAVRILDDSGAPLGVGQVGNIAIKGAPLMQGYLDDPAANASAFFCDGWFNTGDMGYLDKEGWIYLTCRSKEVINRGGEIISPMEVEEAVASHERVKQVMAFSAPHHVLQEVVGVAIVPDPTRPRVDLVGLQQHVAHSLHPSKWPQVLVYMDELPKGQANKLQRIRFAERTGLQAVNDLAPQILRMFEATCPPRASSLQTEIRQELVHADLQDVMAAIKRLQQPLGIAQCAVVALEGRDPVANVVYVAPCTVDVDEVMKALGGILHDYVMPKEILKLDAIPSDSCKLPVPSCQGKELGFVAPRTKTEATIQAFWEQILERPQVGVETDFFEIGGSSLLAGRLVAQLRRSLGVAMTAASVFSNRTIASMAAASDAMLEAAARDRADDAGVHVVEEHAALEEGNNGVLRWVDRVTEHQQLETKDGWVTNGFEGPGKGLRLKPYSQTAPAALICQALPLVLLYPLRRISTWLIFVAIWMFLQTHYLPVRQTCTASCSCPVVGNHTVLPTPTCSDNSGTCTCQAMDRLGALVLALIFGRLIAYLVFPLLGMAFKWVVIGRYRVGRYPLWGQYYLRWWLVDQVLMICGRGVFRYHPRLLNLYYRMMGARIGARVVIDPRARVGEFDLVAIGTDTAIDNVRVRPFCLDSGCMVLAPLRIGDKVSVARKVHLAPGIEVPDGSALGPNCSTYDLNPFTTRPENRALCAARFPTPGLVPACVGYLLLVATFIAEQVPVLLVLHQMVLYPWYVRHLRSYKDVLIWFLSPGRIGFYIALRVVRRTLCPLVRLAVVMLLKRVVIGRFEEGPWTHSPRKILRRWIMERLMPGERLQEVGHLIGSHYSFMTWTLRGLGAKVGERIYWPGSNFEGLVEYDLLHVEDDVVFGSRSAILCADACEAAPIRIAAGANVSDRCVLLPGCTIGRNAVMGSGSLCAKHTSYAAGSKCVGSKGGKVVVLERGSGEAEMEETLKPFGRAFHLGQAPFCVLPSALHFVINATSRCFASVYHSLTLISVIQLSALIMGWTHLKQHQCTLSELATIMLPLFIVVHNVMAVLALLMAIAIKYVIIGKRRPGVYNWDHSSYCQRWQVYLSATALIRNSYFGNGILDHLNGSAYLVWFFRAHGCHIGRDVCLYPTGADPIMTEPELVQIGDQAAIDDASLIAHINSKGHFSLNSLVVGPRATLRAHSRLLSGAAMMPGSTLLEHTLVLSGDVVDQGETVQGWPAEPVAQFSPFWRVADLPSYDGHRQVPSVLRDSL